MAQDRGVHALVYFRSAVDNLFSVIFYGGLDMELVDIKTIIEMAREAGFVEYELEDYTESGYDIRYERFAELVRADEREKSLKLWMLLDDIDTADDIAKTDHDTYRKLCRNAQQKRWAVLNESEVDAAIRARGNT